jgi:hypothetical protein
MFEGYERHQVEREGTGRARCIESERLPCSQLSRLSTFEIKTTTSAPV